jgi:agmatinase
MCPEFVRPTFLGIGVPYEQAMIVLMGCPMDDTASYRPGSRFAPKAIRDASVALETYSPALRSDLLETAFCDMGDLDIAYGRKEKAMDQIADAAKEILSDRKLLISMGGEHLISLPLITESARLHPDLKVVHLDAHADMREEYQGETLSHATVMRRALDVVGAQNLYQTGIRSGTREEFELMEKIGSLHGWSTDCVAHMINSIGSSPCYISLDLDILDPGVFPAIGVPEPGGLTFKQVMDVLYQCKDLRVVGIDLVEYNPLFDPSGHCSVTAAKIARELLLLFAH